MPFPNLPRPGPVPPRRRPPPPTSARPWRWRPSARAPKPQAPVAEETSLDLILEGVVVRSDPAQSSALISHRSDTRSYGPGESIDGVARLISVAATQVVIEVDGREQTLSFPRPGDGDAAAPVAATTGVGRLRAAIAAPDPAAASTDQPETTDDYIKLWRDRITANPQEVLDQIGLISTENGYRIAEQHDSGVDRAGLRTGDLVRSVNGQAVGNVDRDRKLYDQIAASGMARVEVERDGRTIVLSFPLR